MLPLSIIKHAAIEAMYADDDISGGPCSLHTLMDPQSVLDLIEIAETRITDEELHALHQVIAELGDYIRRTAPGPDAMRLLLDAKRIVTNTSR
jgi:hypothetical protein